MSTARNRLRSRSVTLGLTALVAASLTGCGGGADNQAVCVDPETEVRVDDDECDDVDDDYHYGGGGGFYWFYIRAGNTAPAVGGRINPSSGTYDSSTLSGTTKKGGVSTSGGTVERGGWCGMKSGS